MTNVNKINDKLKRELTVGEYCDLIERMLETIGRDVTIENRNSEGQR